MMFKINKKPGETRITLNDRFDVVLSDEEVQAIIGLLTAASKSKVFAMEYCVSGPDEE